MATSSVLRRRGGMILLTAVLLASQGFGQVHVEIGDAGNLPGSAQVISDLPVLTTISGNIGVNDQDMYRFRITGAPFTATVSFLTPLADSQLYLFDAAGFGLFGNDDAFALAGPSEISATLAPGEYLLAISEFNFDPLSADGRIFPDDFFGQVAATGPGAGLPISGWTASTGQGFAYQITLTNAAGVPGPGNGVPDHASSLALLSFCMLTVLAVRRRFGS